MRKHSYPFLALIPLSACTTVCPLGHATLVVKPEVGYRVQSDVKPSLKADINHLMLKLCDTSDQEMGINLDIPQAELDCPVVFNNLRTNTTYRVRAYAYADAGTGQCISVDASSSVDITVITDDQPNIAPLKVKLLDAIFDGQGTASEITVTPGELYCNDPMQMQIQNRAIVTRLAGSSTAGLVDGTGTAAMFNSPSGLAVDILGNLYVADTSNHCIRKVTSAGVVTTIAGNGTAGYADATGSAARFNNPMDIALDSHGNLFVADRENRRIRKITSDGVVSTFAGSGEYDWQNGVGVTASFGNPSGIVVDAADNLYVTDREGNQIRKITQDGAVSTFAGNSSNETTDGVGMAACFSSPTAITMDPRGNMYVLDSSRGNIRKITPSAVVTTVCSAGYMHPAYWYDLAADALGNLYYGSSYFKAIDNVLPSGNRVQFAGEYNFSGDYRDGTGAAAGFNQIHGMVMGKDGTLYVSETHRIRVVR